MDGVKRSDMVVASPIGQLPGAGASNGSGAGAPAGKVGRGTAVSPRAPVDAPPAISVPEGTAANLPAPVRARQLEVRGLVRDMAASPPVDIGRVQALRAQISAGTFAVDPARVADAMLGSLRGA